MHTGPLRHHVVKKRAQEGEALTQTFWTGVIDVIIYPIGFISLAITLPQAYEVWILHNTAGVSLITWATWTVISVFWILYAGVHKAKALFIMQVGWLFMNGLVTVGLLLYS